jgi:hypothetical protein
MPSRVLLDLGEVPKRSNRAAEASSARCPQFVTDADTPPSTFHASGQGDHLLSWTWQELHLPAAVLRLGGRYGCRGVRLASPWPRAPVAQARCRLLRGMRRHLGGWSSDSVGTGVTGWPAAPWLAGPCGRLTCSPVVLVSPV